MKTKENKIVVQRDMTPDYIEVAKQDKQRLSELDRRWPGTDTKRDPQPQHSPWPDTTDIQISVSGREFATLKSNVEALAEACKALHKVLGEISSEAFRQIEDADIASGLKALDKLESAVAKYEATQ